MAGMDVNRVDPVEAWAEPLAAWLTVSKISSERSRRAVLAFGRFSVWVRSRGLFAADVDEDLVDAYVAAEEQRSGSKVTAAAQYLPLVKRFLSDHGVLILRPPASRGLDGRPRLQGGPLDEVVLDLVSWLKEQGYAVGTASSVACTAARLSCWMSRQRLDVQDLDDTVLTRFVASQSRGRDWHPSSARRIVTVRNFFLATSLLTPPSQPPPVPTAPAEQLLEDWIAHLRAPRGLSQGWAAECRGWVQDFVTELPIEDGQLVWDGVDVTAVNRYVARRGQGYSLSSRRHLVSAMRGLLDWAFLTGQVSRSISAGILRPATPAAPALPRALTPGQVLALVAAADTSTPTGLRDRAIVVLISRLGLRAGEVATLTLDDVDWHAGTLMVHGKSGRVLRLPVPVDVGQALVDYLRDGRPVGASDRAVFTRSRPPLVGLGRQGISGVVAHLATVAGLGTVHAHALRHTAATAVLACGGSLVEARELLGHARTDTTMIYARTDLAALRVLAPTWGKVPGP
ncbi:tyrosine-type recombinase/integrase [Ornithinimicrobium cryptoxanthini]|uniref:Tyrosine-type recombinase/integrase n=1 Tax=Ornithinimicrobium cryptoxanthini TaxID=2934161 RepID=A0ABY4YIL8_9MICO|nr:tyrosine-type recombinase/integrase [Ornithinimicrobium cryptoxanthini]USQ76100.1 tyrosine-type recombinase/integrase [Ornithinimicrobium cryptoxanthini]